jgi:hypothetical protein
VEAGVSALPPGAHALLSLLTPHAEQIEGDLLEECADVEARAGCAAARRFLYRQLAASLTPLARRRLQPFALPLVAAVCAAVVTASSLGVLWGLVLWLVPLRADHAPAGPFAALAAAASIAAGAAAFAATRALQSTKGVHR